MKARQDNIQLKVENHQDGFSIRIAFTVPSCKIPRDQLPFVAREQQQANPQVHPDP
jgi:hypothetical protein